MEILRFILSHFFIRGKPVTRWRDYKTGRFVKKPNFYRAVISINGVPLNHNYWNFTFQKIDLLENIDLNQMKRRLIEEMETFLGWKIDDWWFEIVFKVQSPRLEPDATFTDEYFEHRRMKR